MDEKKRIIEFDAAESVPVDGQIPIDSASQGTKKITPALLLTALWTKVGTVGLNTNAKNCSGAINELKGTLTTSTDTSVTGLACYKSANAVWLKYNALTMRSPDDTGKYITQVIPSGYRPSENFYQYVKVHNGSQYVDAELTIRTNGVITIATLSGGAVANVNPSMISPNCVSYVTS